jgi:hypothetical protein
MLGRSRQHSAYARRTYRRELGRFLRANAWPLSVAALFFLIGAVAMTVVTDGYVVGLSHGILAAGYLGAVFTSFHLVVGTHRQLAGMWGEDNTQDELRRARRRRLISGWVDNLEIPSGDVDHLVVLRNGTLLALDSKWATATTPADCHRHVGAAAAAAARARNILRHVGVTRPVVQPVVVLWGGAQSDLPKPWVTIDEVVVVKGRSLRAWLATQATNKTASHPVVPRTLLRDLRRFRREISLPVSVVADQAR